MKTQKWLLSEPRRDWYVIRQAILDAGMALERQPVVTRDHRELMRQRGRPAIEVIKWEGALFDPNAERSSS